MEKLLKSRINHDLWISVAQKVQQVGGGVAASVEESLTNNFISELPVPLDTQNKGRFDHQRNLQESLDVLHDCLIFSKPGKEEILPAVRQAYLTFCQALLRAEAEETGRVQTSVARSLEILSTLPRPLYKHLTYLQDAVNIVKKTACLLKRKASAVKSGKDRLLLLADQAHVGLNLLVSVTKELELPLPTSSQAKAGVSYVVSRLVWCLEEATCDADRDDSGAQCGQFIMKMDEAMAMLEGESEDLTGLQELCEDLLGHAMSVAHVALGNDAKIISQVCQKVLAKKQDLKLIEEENDGLQGLRLGCLADALLLLEQTVNTSLLRLVLEVFSDISGPLDRLLQAKTESEVAEKVAAFDLHVDRIMQAGMFAVACSSDAPRVAGVRSCLASIESLEPELVPAVLACRSGPSSQPEENAAELLAKFYAQHWRAEASRLEKLLDQLVDPPAFCQVTADELQRCQSCISSLTVETSAQAKIHAEEMVKAANKLHSLLMSLTSQGESLGCDNQVLSDLTFYLAELKAATCQANSPKWLRRVSQRARLLCRSVRTLADQLHESLSKEDVFPVTHTTNADKVIPAAAAVVNEERVVLTDDESEDEREDAKASKQEFPDSVRDLPMDVTTTPKQTSVKQLFDLTPFLARGKQLCDARSVLYRTPIATPASTRLTAAPMTDMHDITVAEDCAVRQLFIPEVSSQDDDSMKLNITDILEGLSGLNDTLNSETSEVNMAPVTRGTKIGASLRMKRNPHRSVATNLPQMSQSLGGITSVFSTMCSPSLGSQAVSLAEREKDLVFLQDKIEKLKQAL